MATAERIRLARGLKSSPVLRLLAALVALLLMVSALGQTAHFLLVPHTICAEHGELLELGEGALHVARARERAVADEHRPRAASTEAAASHDHCQVLARGQREQAIPKASPSDLVPAAAYVKSAVFFDRAAVVQTRSTLALAPKTSPPFTPSC